MFVSYKSGILKCLQQNEMILRDNGGRDEMSTADATSRLRATMVEE